MSNYILQIDTATEVCSVSISENGKLLVEKSAEEPNMHASSLTGYIDASLKELQLAYHDLTAVAVSMGPGSYTGLRIGVSTAKGLCYALDIPLLGVNTLSAMFEGYASLYGLREDTLYVPMLDARRMEVYMAVFDDSKAEVKDTAAVVVEADTFENFNPKKVVLFGSGANKLKSLLEASDSVTVDERYVHSSSFLSALAYHKWKNNEFENLIYFEPFYLKEFVATTPKKIVGL